MKSSILKIAWVMIVSFYFTLTVSVTAIVYNVLNKMTRRWVDRVSRLWARRMLRAAQVTFSVHNPHHVNIEATQPCILMCNHSSLYDIPLILAALPGSIRMLAKKEMIKIPFLGSAMLHADFPFIDRHHHHQAVKDLTHVKKLMQEGIIVWIAPEGTRSSAGELLKFKKGGFIAAIQASAQIIPIGIRGAHTILPAKSLQLYLNQHAEIHIGEPINAASYTLQQKEDLLTEVRHRIQTLMTAD